MVLGCHVSVGWRWVIGRRAADSERLNKVLLVVVAGRISSLTVASSCMQVVRFS